MVKTLSCGLRDLGSIPGQGKLFPPTLLFVRANCARVQPSAQHYASQETFEVVVLFYCYTTLQGLLDGLINSGDYIRGGGGRINDVQTDGFFWFTGR